MIFFVEVLFIKNEHYKNQFFIVFFIVFKTISYNKNLEKWKKNLGKMGKMVNKKMNCVFCVVKNTFTKNYEMTFLFYFVIVFQKNDFFVIERVKKYDKKEKMVSLFNYEVFSKNSLTKN